VNKSFRVGDIITIIVLETTSAVQKAGTDTNVNDNLSSTLDHTIASLNIQPSNFVKATAGNTYRGLGSTTRTSNVTAKIAAVVVKVMPNGNLMISGDHRVEVNDEIQTIRISGIVRPKDVSLQNTVYSYQVAGADVSVKGKGVVGEADSPGVFTRFFNWIF
jgi:flagellar L-ring protein precursor FlgH